jgi:Protein of unknown function (DUF2934)
MKLIGRKTVKTDKTSAPMVKSGKVNKSATSVVTAPSHEDIAKRSYELYLARGGEAGHEVEDWLQAESDLAHG